MSHSTIQAYFDAFNVRDMDGMLACLTDDVAHHVNEGQIRYGKAAFAEFCTHMSRCYREKLTEIVILTNGDRAAAEYLVNGQYVATDDGCPEARGQTYILPAGSFFTLMDTKIARVTTHYNFAEWTRQVS